MQYKTVVSGNRSAFSTTPIPGNTIRDISFTRRKLTESTETSREKTRHCIKDCATYLRQVAQRRREVLNAVQPRVLLVHPAHATHPPHASHAHPVTAGAIHASAVARPVAPPVHGRHASVAAAVSVRPRRRQEGCRARTDETPKKTHFICRYELRQAILVKKNQIRRPRVRPVESGRYSALQDA